MSTTPNYASTPRIGSAGLTTADANRTTPTNFGIVLAAGASGSRIDRMSICATATTTAGMVRLFIHDGTTYRLIKEVQILPVTVSATQPAYAVDLTFDGGIALPTGYSLRASTEKNEAFSVVAYGADF